MSILVVGTMAFDSVKTPYGERDDVLGGSACYLATAASFFAPLQLAGVIGEDFPQAHLNFLHERNVDLAGVQKLPGKSFRWRGHYEADLNTAHTLETQLNVLQAFKPDLPEHYRDAQYVVLGNFDPELQLSVLDQVRAPKLVVCDTMNYWIERHNDKLRRTLGKVDLLSISEGEARLLSGETNLLRAAAAIAAMGPKRLIIKRGEYGAILFDEAGIFVAPSFPLEVVRDPTGAGDTFAGGLVGYLWGRDPLDPTILRQAVVMGSIMASFVVEDFSNDRLRRLQPREVEERIAQYSAYTHFAAPQVVPQRQAPPGQAACPRRA